LKPEPHSSQRDARGSAVAPAKWGHVNAAIPFRFTDTIAERESV
jgi:hypothetical protein